MHGRPRKPPAPDDAASIEKATKLRTLQNLVLHNHHNKIYTKEALDLSSKLLVSNPELYTAWNYRKLAVEHNLGTENDHDSIKSILNEELRVVESALRKNFKSYGAWHHRKWVLSKGSSSFDHEFELLDQFQKADSRNFHAWNYRRFVAALKNVSEKEELDHTTDMIDTNFSNYSAWHNRSAILTHLLKQKAQGYESREKVLTEEYEYVHGALFTDPDDQSGWFYHLWLLDQTITPDAPKLVTSWPTHGSDLLLSLQRNLESSPTRYYSEVGTFPLILYFNQAVGGVSSSTVDVKYTCIKNEDLIWTPLSTNNSRKAHAWVTYLNFPNATEQSLKAYPVDVSVGYSHGIISPTGSVYDVSTCFSFKVSLQSFDLEHTEGGGTERIEWKDDHFRSNDALDQDLSPILSFDQLRVSNNHERTASNWRIETILEEIDLFRAMLQDKECKIGKIGKLTLARLLMAHDAMMSYNTSFAYEKVNSEEVLELFGELMKLDPSHARYYKDAHSLVLIEKVLSKRKSLMKHCCYYGASTTPCLSNCLCLRLPNLSLSRIGSFEHLLWVQMLDLSCNELQSIEGLEAMQLLSCLNLSYNKFRSITALEPLRLLKSLKVVDISYNEIGMHSTDTTRYLCSSPLSHNTTGHDFNTDDYETNGVRAADYWEAVLVLKGLELTQLDVVGNAIADDKFRLLLVKLLPKLKWLDGKAVH